MLLPEQGSSKVYNPQEEALQSLCKQLLKARIFRGFYEERRYVENINSYRDIIRLQRGERELEKLLLDIRQKLELFYHANPNLWIGVTNGVMFPLQQQNSRALQTSIWAEMDDLAFGQYWFIIRSIRFRDNEIMLKLKMMRSIDDEPSQSPHQRRYSQTSHKDKTVVTNADTTATINSTTAANISIASATSNATQTNATTADDEKNNDFIESPISLQDFIAIVRQWGATIKYSVYNFMYEDITKENIVAVLKFIGLVIVTLLTASISAIKFLGIFTLRFMFEFSRLTHALSPIIFRIIDVINRMIGGFYILLTMIWKDVFINRGQPINQRDVKYIEYHSESSEHRLQRQPTEFERKFQ